MLNLQKKLFATADSADYEELVHQLSINASQQMPTTTDTLQATYSRHKKNRLMDVKENDLIDHFRVPVCLRVKRSLSPKPFI